MASVVAARHTAHEAGSHDRVTLNLRAAWRVLVEH
jgi:hypothetical protein